MRFVTLAHLESRLPAGGRKELNHSRSPGPLTFSRFQFQKPSTLNADPSTNCYLLGFFQKSTHFLTLFFAKRTSVTFSDHISRQRTSLGGHLNRGGLGKSKSVPGTICGTISALWDDFKIRFPRTTYRKAIVS